MCMHTQNVNVISVLIIPKKTKEKRNILIQMASRKTQNKIIKKSRKIFTEKNKSFFFKVPS